MAQMSREASMVNFETDSISGDSHTASITSQMGLKTNVRSLYERVHTVLRQSKRKEKKEMAISVPFDFKREPVALPGITEEELAILREKAAASCIGVAEDSMYPGDELVVRPRRNRSPYSRSPSPFSIASHRQANSTW